MRFNLIFFSLIIMKILFTTHDANNYFYCVHSKQDKQMARVNQN